MDTPKPMQGTWKLVRPDGRIYHADSPLRCASFEMSERVPPIVQVARVLAMANEPDFAERHVQLGKLYAAANTDDLIDKMDAHVVKLQNTVMALTTPFSFSPERVRKV